MSAWISNATELEHIINKIDRDKWRWVSYLYILLKANLFSFPVNQDHIEMITASRAGMHEFFKKHVEKHSKSMTLIQNVRSTFVDGCIIWQIVKTMQ